MELWTLHFVVYCVHNPIPYSENNYVYENLSVQQISNISACQPKLGKILELTTPTEAAPPRNAQYQCYLEIQLLFQCKYTVVSVHVIQCHFSVIPV